MELVSVQVLLSTYNGEKYLVEQIESILCQNGVKVFLTVRDDGSTDKTKEILQNYEIQGKLKFIEGQNLKSAASFFELINSCDTAEYYALADQDDYWMPNKLSNAIAFLQSSSENISKLYFSKAQLVDEDLIEIPHKGYPENKLSLSQALLTNNATGCTFVFNDILRNHIIAYTPSVLTMHDHWIYLLALALDGYIVYDKNSFIKYRQHSNNVCGGKRGFLKKFKTSGLNEKNNVRKKMAIELYDAYQFNISDNNKTDFTKIIQYSDTFMNKLSFLFTRNYYTNSITTNISIILSILLNKV